MMYYKNIDETGFVSISTVNTDGEGNITVEEYEELLRMLRAAPDGYGIKEISGGFAYAEIPEIIEE